MIGQAALPILAVVLPVLLVVAACARGSSPSVPDPVGAGTVAPLLAATAGAAALSSGAESQAIGSQPAVPASSVGSKESRLDVVIDERTIPLRNGAKVFLGDDLAVEVFVDPYPPTTLRASLDLYLTRAGVPVTAAEVAIDYEMLYMGHGLLKAQGKNLRDGHYLASLEYLMYGAWGHLVKFRLPEKQYELSVVIVAYP